MSPGIWPTEPLPEGTVYKTWVRAASLAKTTVDELLRDKIAVRAACYEAAQLQLDSEAQIEELDPDRSPEPAERLLGAEQILTSGLRLLHNGEPEQALHLLIAAANEVSRAIQESTTIPESEPS